MLVLETVKINWDHSWDLQAFAANYRDDKIMGIADLDAVIAKTEKYNIETRIYAFLEALRNGMNKADALILLTADEAATVHQHTVQGCHLVREVEEYVLINEQRKRDASRTCDDIEAEWNAAR